MIPRYTLPEMGRIWSDAHRYALWLQIELAVLEAYVQTGRISPEVYSEIAARVRFSQERMEAIEQQTQHDVVAFVESVAESLGDLGRYIHLGLTSSDILDTATAIQMKESCDLLLQRIDHLCTVLKEKAIAYRDIACVGRTHGVHAEPMTFGLKFLLWYAEFQRHRERLAATRQRVAVGKISGAVGVYAHLEPEVERIVCTKFGLQPEPVSNQITQRDRHAEYVLTLALIGASIEKVALEIRHLQRTEVREAEEPFRPGQKGSSAMPHKRNPITAERLCGLARVLRAYAMAAMENVALWHERDISHSSVERIILPDASIALDYMLDRCIWLIAHLRVHPDRMDENLRFTKGLIFSSGILVALIEKGVSRVDAYRLVQRNAMRAWEAGTDFIAAIRADPEVMQYLTPDDIARYTDIEYYKRHINTIYQRVLGDSA